MESVPSIDTDDEGKPVYDPTGDRVGVVTRADGGTVHVDPNPDLTDTAAAKLGWTFTLQGSQDAYAVDATAVEFVGDDRVVVGEATR